MSTQYARKQLALLIRRLMAGDLPANEFVAQMYKIVDHTEDPTIEFAEKVIDRIAWWGTGDEGRKTQFWSLLNRIAKLLESNMIVKKQRRKKFLKSQLLFYSWLIGVIMVWATYGFDVFLSSVGFLFLVGLYICFYFWVKDSNRADSNLLRGSDLETYYHWLPPADVRLPKPIELKLDDAWVNCHSSFSIDSSTADDEQADDVLSSTQNETLGSESEDDESENLLTRVKNGLGVILILPLFFLLVAWMIVLGGLLSPLAMVWYFFNYRWEEYGPVDQQ